MSGCTGVPDFYKSCCDDHDEHYSAHDVTRAEADAEFRRCIQGKSPLGKCSPMALWRWAGVRLLGRHAWRRGGHPDGHA